MNRQLLCPISMLDKVGSDVRRQLAQVLPATLVRTAVHVQHLSGDLAGLGEVDNGIHEVADSGNCPHRRERLQEAL